MIRDTFLKRIDSHHTIATWGYQVMGPIPAPLHTHAHTRAQPHNHPTHSQPPTTVYKSLATHAPLPCVDQDAIAVRRHQQFGVPLKPPNLKEGGRRKEEGGNILVSTILDTFLSNPTHTSDTHTHTTQVHTAHSHHSHIHITTHPVSHNRTCSEVLSSLFFVRSDSPGKGRRTSPTTPASRGC